MESLMGCCGRDRDAEQDQNKSNRPREQSFYQQRLPAWQPLLTARTVYPLFFVIAICFVPLGAYMYTVSQSVFELEKNYTHCLEDTIACSDKLAKPPTRAEYRVCYCNVTFELKEDVQGEVFMYYRLTNYFQNHRRYVKSRDDEQLHGVAKMNPTADCDPYRYWEGNSSVPFAPCGAVANSLFNDTFTLHFQNASTSNLTSVGLIKSGIAWSTDVNTKFGNPPDSYWSNVMKPINWEKAANVRTKNPFRGDEDLIVWMRTAALPKFRKLYRRINHTNEFKDGLPKGSYVIKIAYAYPVTSFGGTKSIILSTTTWMGGKNDVLGISYMVIGCIHFVLAFAFVIIDVKTRKRNTSFDIEEPTTAWRPNFLNWNIQQEVVQQIPQTSSLNVETDQRV